MAIVEVDPRRFAIWTLGRSRSQHRGLVELPFDVLGFTHQGMPASFLLRREGAHAGTCRLTLRSSRQAD